MVEGFLELTESNDLFKKLEWEYANLSKNPTNSYIAFNFFVTAWHLLEWIYPDPAGKAFRKSLRDETPLLQTCEHLAVGAKHFAPSSPNHHSVAGSERRDSWGGSWGQSWGKSWCKTLVVVLDGQAKDRYGQTITVPDLADQIMEFWRNHIRETPTK